MQRDHTDPECSDGAQREMNQPGQHDHRNANRPNDLQHASEVIVEIEPGDDPDDSEFQEDQPQPTRDQKPRQLGLAFASRHLKKCACSSEEDKDRRAKVSDVTGEEENDRRFGRIGWIEVHYIAVEEIARMVQQHDDHH